ncbi:MAG: elongation factor P [Candidatus Lindowbacteria bacterium RIFCSPLOWO2_12_FULL_62_27]|nr:MAG: elongation factor P [Candidatus Lindowbacteria bacterium RIFCSPLOWO2_12_FULL_62_27]
MAQIGPNEFKNGITIQYEHRLCTILEFQHVKMQMRAPTIKTRLRDIKTGQVLEINFRQGDKFEQVYMETRKMQFMYATDDSLVFLDLKDYEEKNVPKTLAGEAANFIPESAEISVNFLEGNPLTVELPAAMTLTIKASEAGVKGDRVSGATKLATLETGHQLQVPVFIQPGDRIRVDTRSGEYIGKE